MTTLDARYPFVTENWSADPAPCDFNASAEAKTSCIVSGGDVKCAFERLVEQWAAETDGMSLVRDKVRHPAYQQIIALGWFVVPYILAEIRQGNIRHWFKALRQITGANPVQSEHLGDLKKMGEDWLQWGQRVNLI